jgi:hypothetical protein
VPTRTLLVVAIGLLPGIVAGQGLGGAARKEANRREHKGTSRIESLKYTSADLESDSGQSEETDAAAGDGTPGVVEAAPATLEPAGDAPDEADRLREELDRAAAQRRERERKWRARAAAARAKVDAARKEHDAVCNSSPFALAGG